MKKVKDCLSIYDMGAQINKYCSFNVYLQREKTDASKLAPLGAAYNSLPQQAVEYSLACVALPGDVSRFVMSI